MSSSSDSSSGGIGFFGLLGIVFIVLKLCKVIDWSWFYVLMPIWGPIVGALAFLAIVLVVYLCCMSIDAIKKSKRA